MHIPPELHASNSFIHEQQVIWNEIISKSNRVLNFSGVVALANPDDCKLSTASFDDRSRQANEDEDTDSYDENAKDNNDSLEGQQVALHGSLIKILGRSRVYDALADGTTKIITCIGCESNLLATLSTRLLFCPDCGTLTPIDLSVSQSRSDSLQQVNCDRVEDAV
jgi:hypothetical protein